MEKFPSQENSPKGPEEIKLDISRLMEEKLTSAVGIKKFALDKGEDKDVVEILQSIWPENDGRSWQRKPEFNILGLDKPLSIRFDQHSAYDSTNGILTLDLSEIRNIQNPEDLDAALLGLLEDVYHESEHIYTPGSPIEDPQDPEETIEYLSHPGEIEAHARQFAFRYTKEFPGQEFELEKMIDITKRSTGKRKNKYLSYFIDFADPKKQEKYKKFADLKSIHEDVIEATRRHLRVLSGKP